MDGTPSMPVERLIDPALLSPLDALMARRRPRKVLEDRSTEGSAMLYDAGRDRIVVGTAHGRMRVYHMPSEWAPSRTQSHQAALVGVCLVRGTAGVQGSAAAQAVSLAAAPLSSASAGC